MLHPNETSHDPANTPVARPRRRALRPLLCGAALITALAAPPGAAAADTLVAPDAAADQVTALDDTIVWVSGTYGKQTLWQKTAGGVARVKGAPEATLYRTVDLGRNTKNKLVLTYQRCNTSICRTLTDDLKGHRRSFRHLEPKRCRVTTAPARWRSRSAYGLACRKSNGMIDEGRSGLYVKTGSKAPKRLPRPGDTSMQIESVDLRGTYAAAINAGYQYAFVQTTAGKNKRSIFVAASEGDNDQDAPGLALGPGGTMYSLTTAANPGDQNQAIIFRVTDTCYETQALIKPPGPNQALGFRASDIAVDGSNVYLVAPGIGIVTHEFTPRGPCSPL